MSDAPAPLLALAIEGVSPGRALDLACGQGRHTIFLAERGWSVQAVDVSREAIDALQHRALAPALAIDARVANLEADEFSIASSAWDLICDSCYLQRSLFPRIRRGIRPGGLFVAIICTVDTTPEVKPMNPDYLLEPGELRAEFAGWDILYYAESKREVGRRRVAELIARRPGESVPRPE